MKQYSFGLDERLLREFFKPVRSKKDVISVLMKSMKLMLVGDHVPDEKKVGELVLMVSKMSRLFYFSEKKYFSISFPYLVNEVENGVEFSSKTISHIDNQITSDVLSILSQEDLFGTDCAYEFIEPIVDMENHEPLFWPFILGLFMHEDGYVRYDFDEENEDGNLHPLNHYDFFYSSFSGCKIGLREKPAKERMMDLLMIESNCHFFET